MKVMAGRHGLYLSNNSQRGKRQMTLLKTGRLITQVMKCGKKVCRILIYSDETKNQMGTKPEGAVMKGNQGPYCSPDLPSSSTLYSHYQGSIV